MVYLQNNVLDYLEETVCRVPEKTAFSDGTDSMTFYQVYEESRSVASWIHAQGYYREPVIVFMNRHPREITVFFGVIRGGCFYVPVDGDMSGARISQIQQNVRSRIVVCDEETIGVARTLDLGGKLVTYNEIRRETVDVEALKEIHDKALDTDLIYVVFTSGSTGIPKGVAACHRSVLDYIAGLSDVMEFDGNTVFGSQAPLYFDACIKELYSTLKYGATTYLIPKELFVMPVKLVEFLNIWKINTICWVSSALAMVSAFDTFKTVMPEYLKNIAFGGEVFPVKQFMRWREALPDARFTNLYGPTEATGMCCYYKVEREFGLDEVIPIGRPFFNTEIFLLDEQNCLVGSGEIGEICIRGTSLTMGYYNDFEKTNEAFVQNPLNDAYPEWIYRTGDLGKYNEFGELIFISRKDYQVKHWGHRIELGEIEVNVSRLEGVGAAGCIYDGEKNRIILFYTGNIEEKELVGRLKELLPRYMIPNYVRRLRKMPLTAGGKLDRAVLKAFYQRKGE